LVVFDGEMKDTHYSAIQTFQLMVYNRSILDLGFVVNDLFSVTGFDAPFLRLRYKC